ncbi:MAG: MmcB family DNA repair protein [Alphaproteobacteria bacterium]|nr:MmcB family DNA repair protein [Alphaproteobacteria bacterium]
MQNLLPLEALAPLASAARPDVTAAITRGAARLFVDLGLAPLAEFRLPNGRRADLAGLDAKGRLTIAEVKSCQADFESDGKWEDYLGYCDEFYFAVSNEFPHSLLPPGEGLIVADAFGGAILRAGRDRPMAAARRKSIMLRFARQAAARAASLGARFDG